MPMYLYPSQLGIVKQTACTHVTAEKHDEIPAKEIPNGPRCEQTKNGYNRHRFHHHAEYRQGMHAQLVPSEMYKGS